MDFNNVDQSYWYERECVPREYGFTLFRDSEGKRTDGRLDAINISADRWSVKGGVLHFHQGPWRNYSIATHRVRWIRRNF